MICKALPTVALGVTALAAAGSCPEARPAPEPREPRPAATAVAAPTTPAATETRKAPPPDLRPAIERALAVLQADGDAWMEGSAPFQDGNGCVSCHQVPYGLWALHEAARDEIVLDPAALADLTRRAVVFIDDAATGRPMSWSPTMLALWARPDAPDLSSYLGHLLRTQRPAGFWEAKGQFPAQRRELSETNAVATMFAMHALWLHDADADDPAIAESLERGWSWVEERGPGTSSEWLAMRLTVSRIGDDWDEQRRLKRQLMERQNENGGWSWKPGEESNAMSTGQALWALWIELKRDEIAARLDGGPTERWKTVLAEQAEVGRRGIDYLLATQGDDGWWRVASDLTSKRREASKDYVYDYWGTAWATIGLARWHESKVVSDQRRGAHEPAAGR